MVVSFVFRPGRRGEVELRVIGRAREGMNGVRR